MGTSINIVKCKDCGAYSSIALEWLSKNDVKKEIEKTKCSKCGSDNWYLTDEILDRIFISQIKNLALETQPTVAKSQFMENEIICSVKRIEHA